MIEYASETLTLYCGGATTYSAVGTWTNSENLPISEPITVVRALSRKNNDFHMEYLAERVRRKCNQDEVLWTKQQLSIMSHKG